MAGVGTETSAARVWKNVTALAQACVDTAFPPLCSACREFNEHHPDLCECCNSRVQITETPACLTCHTPWLDKGKRLKCCESPLPLNSYGHYETPLREMILDLKFHGMTLISDVLVERLLTVHPDLRQSLSRSILVPIPLHVSHERVRGYNQAALLAESLSRQTQSEVRTDIVLRLQKRQQQAKLALDKRPSNVAGAFAIAEDIGEVSVPVAIIDDVVTSGATVREVARVLASRGIKVESVISAASNYLW